MKTLLTIFTLVFTVMFSSTSFAGWTKVSENVHGTFYVDFERIRKVDGYIYFWWLSDFLKPNKWGSLSAQAYSQGDCKLFRTKYLEDLYYKGQMGKGNRNGGSNKPDKNWTYPNPDSVHEMLLKSVCK